MKRTVLLLVLFVTLIPLSMTQTNVVTKKELLEKIMNLKEKLEQQEKINKSLSKKLQELTMTSEKRYVSIEQKLAQLYATNRELATKLKKVLNFQKIINVTVHRSYTRKTFKASTSYEIENFIVDKKSPNSSLLIQGTISVSGGSSGHYQQGWKYGDGKEICAQTVNYTAAGDWGIVLSTAVVIPNHKKTGPQNLVFRYFSAAHQYKPFKVYNPNQMDDAYQRLKQTGSVYVVWEIGR